MDALAEIVWERRRGHGWQFLAEFGAGDNPRCVAIRLVLFAHGKLDPDCCTDTYTGPALGLCLLAISFTLLNIAGFGQSRQLPAVGLANVLG